MKICPFQSNVVGSAVSFDASRPENRIRRASFRGKVCFFLLFSGSLFLFPGCSGNRQFGHPTLEPAPGEIQTQRAARFDPYPDPNIGPEMHGVRPHCFTNPSPERTNPTKLTY